MLATGTGPGQGVRVSVAGGRVVAGGDRPVVVGLESVVASAESVQVGGAGSSADGGAGPGRGVVEVGMVGGLGAAGEAAGAIAGDDVVTQGARWGVGGGAVVQEVAVDGVGDESAPGGVGGQ